MSLLIISFKVLMTLFLLFQLLVGPDDMGPYVGFRLMTCLLILAIWVR